MDDVGATRLVERVWVGPERQSVDDLLYLIALDRGQERLVRRGVPRQSSGDRFNVRPINVLGGDKLESLLSRCLGRGLESWLEPGLPYHIGHAVADKKQQFDDIWRERR